MTKLTFVTGNENKYKEASQVISDLEKLDLDLVEIQSIDSKEVIEHKLNEAKKSFTGNLVVEDNSLNLDCLGGLPGPLIKWFLKTLGNEGLSNIALTLNNTKSTAIVTVGLSLENGTTKFFEGVIEGDIVSPRGDNGFGWDAIFQPTGSNKTFAEMTAEEKNEISMRKIAFQKLKDYLSTL